MGFKFPLATVLRVRTLREEREERMLQQILFEISQTLRTIGEIDGALAKLNTDRHATLHIQVQGRDVHAAYGQIAGLEQNKKDLGFHLAKLEELKDRQVKVYEEARRDREMLSDMRKAQRDEYWTLAAKREQKTLDDNFAARLSRQ